MRKKNCFFVLAVAAALLLTLGCGRQKPTQTAPTAPPRQDVTLSDMAYVRPDTARIEVLLESIAEGIVDGADIQRLLTEYDAVRALYQNAESQMALAYLLYAFDVTDEIYREEYAFLGNALNTLDLAVSEVSIALFEATADARTLAEQRYGARYVALAYENARLNDASVQEDFMREQALVLHYDELVATFTLTVDGEEWTYERIMDNASLSYPRFRRLYDAYSEALNRAAGEVFLELMSVRNGIASKLGYGSYAAYRYDCYGRDYTVTDAETLCAAVREHIVPLYVSALQSGRIDFALYEATFDQTRFLLQLQEATADFSPHLGEAYGYLLHNGLYDFAVSDRKMEGSFTTYLSNYRAPYIFSQWGGGYADIGTVLHELGHFFSYYRNDAAGWNMGDSLDLAEVDSQALQLLMTPYYPSFFGELAEAAEAELLLDAMYALLSGCMEDAFQRALYARTDWTLQQINALYKELSDAYGFGTAFDYTGMEWVLIPHTFRTPMYYISYAVGVLPALELWERMQRAGDAATEAYLSIVDRAPYATLRRTLAENGLADVFSEQTILQIADILRKEF